MIRHYLASAFDTFRRAPLATLANIFALALGLACFLGAYGASVYWNSGDAYQRNAERTFIVGTKIDVKAGGPNLGAGFGQLGLSSTSTLARHLGQDIPEVAQVARTSLPAETAVSTGDSKQMLHAAFADAAFLDIFQLDFVAGDPRQALSRPDGVILTQNAAQRLFGSEPALGQPLLIDNTWTGTVTGVISPVRQPSFMGEGQDAVLRFEMLGAWSGHPAAAAADRRDSWLQLDAHTFVVLPASLSLDAFNRRLAALLEARIPAEYTKRATMRSAALPVADMSTRKYDALLESQFGAALSVTFIVLVLGAIALGVAVVNYANLATAQAVMRAKEIGMRRVVGARGFQIMLQSWIEALIQALAAFAVAIGLLALAAPAVRQLSGIDVLYFLQQGGGAWAAAGGVILIVAFLAGAYPAFVLSRVRPASALRSGQSRSGSRPVANILVMIQFASASFLLLLMITAQLQRAHIEAAVLAPREDPILILNDLRSTGVDLDTLRTQLSKQPGVEHVSAVSPAPWDGGGGPRPVNNVRQVGRSLEQAYSANFSYMKTVGLDYFATLNIKLLAGRLLEERDAAPIDPAAASDSYVVIDALLARNLGFETPQAAVGEKVYSFGSQVHIVGVVEADMMRINGIAGEGAGTLYSYYPEFPSYVAPRPIVRISPDNIPSTLAAITNVWDRLAPNTPANFHFFDQLFEQSYRQQARAGQLFIVLGSTCFLIASIGLLGIAVHAASQRRHEVAIRKTLGASVARVVRLLLTDFSIPVLIGNLIAWPLGYLAAQSYLSAFAYRIDLTPAPFLLSLFITLVIAWAAVIGVVLKAASVRPAEVLRHA
jgi:putative ABC transport system permease protein